SKYSLHIDRHWSGSLTPACCVGSPTPGGWRSSRLACYTLYLSSGAGLVNSYTSSFDPHGRYVWGLLALALIPAWALFAIGVYLEPVWGDLTRIGSYAERDFGWNKPQLEFPEPLST